MKILCEADLETAEFKILVERLDVLVTGFSVGVPESSQWKILLDAIGLDETWSDYWEPTVAEYKPNGKLSRKALDNQGILLSGADFRFPAEAQNSQKPQNPQKPE
jgi:hypothetical protein